MNKIKVIGLDYVGYQVGSSLVKMKFEYKENAFKILIGSTVYRLLLINFLPKGFIDLFNSIKEHYIREIIIDGIALSIINIVSINIIGNKENPSKTVIKSVIQSLFSNYIASMQKSE